MNMVLLVVILSCALMMIFWLIKHINLVLKNYGIRIKIGGDYNGTSMSFVKPGQASFYEKFRLKVLVITYLFFIFYLILILYRIVLRMIG